MPFDFNEFTKSYEKDIPDVKFTLPLSKESLFLKPCTSADQKKMLKAIESEEYEIIESVYDVLIKKCVVGDVDVMEMNTVDRKMLLMKIGEISISDEIEIPVTCPKCEKEQVVKVELPKLKIPKVEMSEFVKVIRLDGGDVKKSNPPMLKLGIATRKKMKEIEDDMIEMVSDFKKKNKGLKEEDDDYQKASAIDVSYLWLSAVMQDVDGAILDKENALNVINSIQPKDLEKIRDFVKETDIDIFDTFKFVCNDVAEDKKDSCGHTEQVRINVLHLFAQ